MVFKLQVQLHARLNDFISVQVTNFRRSHQGLNLAVDWTDRYAPSVLPFIFQISVVFKETPFTTYCRSFHAAHLAWFRDKIRVRVPSISFSFTETTRRHLHRGEVLSKDEIYPRLCLYSETTVITFYFTFYITGVNEGFDVMLWCSDIQLSQQSDADQFSIRLSIHTVLHTEKFAAE